jgi:hypothetical protein
MFNLHFSPKHYNRLVFLSYKLRESISVSRPTQRVEDLKMKSVMPFRQENKEEASANKGPEIGL